MSNEPTMDDIEWAAECLYEEVECAKTDDPRCPPYKSWGECPDWFKPLQRAMALHAWEHGYRPPPKPKTVLDEVENLLAKSYWDGVEFIVMAKALLARFNVTRKDES